MTKVLVTGAYGFLGRYTVKELRENGYQVVAFGRDKVKLAQLKDEGVELYQGDFCNLDDIVDACKGVDYVIHCGALMKGWGKKKDFIRTNVEGTRNVLEACEINHVKRLVYTSSPSVKPLENNLHLTEQDYNEDNHISHYVESKIMAEKLVRGQSKVPYAMIRPRGLCGVGDQNMLPLFVKVNSTVGIPMFNKGNVMADLCCIENVALSLRLCMERPEAEGQVYNITNGEPMKMTVLADALFKELGTKPKYLKLPFGLAYGLAVVLEFFFKLFGSKVAPPLTRYNVCTLGRSQIFDISKAERELGYKPKITIFEMFKDYATDYLKNQQK